MIIVLILFLIIGSVNAALVFHAPSDSSLDILAQQAGQCAHLEVLQLKLLEKEVKEILRELAQQRSREQTDQKKRVVRFAVETVGNQRKKKSGKPRPTATVEQDDVPYRVPRASRLAALKAIDAMKASREKEREIQKDLGKLT